MKRPAILLFGDHGQLQQRIEHLLAHDDIALVNDEDGRQISEVLHSHRPQLVLCIASHRSKTEGLQILTRIRAIDTALPVILITAHSSEALAIAALRSGANDFFRIPFEDREFLSSCRRLMRHHKTKSEGETRSASSSCPDGRLLVGSSRAMRDIRAYIERVARTDSTVLITGETGTGKELAAELIHRSSDRSSHPLIRLNCSAMPEGLLESELFGYGRGAFTGAVTGQSGKLELAEGGSLLLDEIGEMKASAQSKILRCIETKTVYPLGAGKAVHLDVRIMAATNQVPEELISEGRFREDLFYRLNVARLHLPPLRERREDIPELAAFAVRKLNHHFDGHVEGLTEAVTRALLRYDWPGNVRELMNVLEGAFINQPMEHIRYADLPVHFRRRLEEAQAPPSQERTRILAALLETNWNKSSAAVKLNWSRMTLYRKMAKYRIVQNRQPACRLEVVHSRERYRQV
jgi:DNA-binding NtrC family response regulator